MRRVKSVSCLLSYFILGVLLLPFSVLAEDEVVTPVSAGDEAAALAADVGLVDDVGLDPVFTDPGIIDTATINSGVELSSPDSTDAEPVPEMSLFALINKGGVVGYLILLISVVALALILDYLLTIRLSRILPAADLAKLRNLIEQKEFDNLDRLDGKENSFLTRVTVAGLREANLGYDAMIKAMEDTAEALASGIARKTEHLNVIGALSPMLGLLGTVLGMLQVFNEIAMTPGAIEPRQLAEGIFQALVTTCLGLIVAIPALYSYAIFRNRVDEFTGEAALAAERLIAPFKISAG